MSGVVSLLPSATEIVAALGIRDELLGRSHECDFPSWVKSLPVLTQPAFSPEGRSREIDRSVKVLLEQGLSLYRVDTEKLKSLQPDFIVTQSQCEVCAVSENELKRALSDWVGRPVQIVSLRPDLLEDVWGDIARVADALGVPERGAALLTDLKERVNVLAQRSKSLKRPRVACIEWLDPLMAAGNWMPELVELAGGTNLFGLAGKHSPWIDWQELRSKDPDIILLLPCGFDISRTRTELSVLTTHPIWRDLSAVKAQRVFITDGNQYFNRPGPRLVESLEILAEIFHPETFEPRWRGQGWCLV